MARPKKQANPEGQPSGGATGNGASISKIDALTEALQQLGQDAKNKALEDYIRSKYGEQAVPGNFSVTKSAVMKKLRQGGNGRKGRRGGRRKAEATAVQPASRPSSSVAASNGISLDDLRQIKELAGRYGKDQIKGVLDLLA